MPVPKRRLGILALRMPKPAGATYTASTGLASRVPRAYGALPAVLLSATELRTMSTATVTLALPDVLYQRLQGAATAAKQPLEQVILRALNLGSPPTWDDVPPEFQLDLAGLDKMNDEALWAVARSRREPAELVRYDELLEKNAEGALTSAEHDELARLREEADRFMLRKAHAAALLRWRGHRVVSP